MENKYYHSLKKIASLFDIDADGDILFNNEAIFRPYDVSNGGQLTDKLSGFIYSNCYCRNAPDGPVQLSERELAKIDDEDFLNQIAAANTSNGKLSERWQVTGHMPNGDPILSKGSDSFSVNYNETVMLPSSNRQAIAYAAIKNNRDKLINKNSFYYLFSDNPESKKNAALLRFYWNIEPSGLSALINRLTAGLNRHYVPFQFKCLKHPALYTRSDACVLYIFPKYLHIATQVISEFISEIGPFLKADVPMLTLKLHDGLAFAESPSGGQSFGMQHSRVLASCLITAFEHGMNAEQKLSHIINTYTSMAYRVEEIYKNPGSVFNYTFLKQAIN